MSHTPLYLAGTGADPIQHVCVPHETVKRIVVGGERDPYQGLQKLQLFHGLAFALISLESNACLDGCNVQVCICECSCL